MCEVAECEDKQTIPSIQVSGKPFDIGLQIGNRFKELINGRLSSDKALKTKLLPFYFSNEGKSLIEELTMSNRTRYPTYWEELQGTAVGANVSFVELLLVNLRKEIIPFLPAQSKSPSLFAADQCSTIMCRSDSQSILVHNEDADESVKDHEYIVEANLPSGISFKAFTYAGELPSCAFGFNNNGVAFTLNAVPPAPSEVVRGGVGRNFVSRDLLEASNFEDALQRAQVSNLAAGHNYNIMDLKSGRIATIETASNNRFSVLEIEKDSSYFHANIYQRLEISQILNQSSVERIKVAESASSVIGVDSMISLLGDDSNEQYPVFMKGNIYEKDGPKLYTLCTVVFMSGEKEVIIFKGNPRNKKVVLKIPIC